MFALTDAMPTGVGVTTKFTPELSTLLPSAFDEGQGASFYEKAKQGLDNRVAAGDDPLVAGIQNMMGQAPEPVLDPEELNKTYGLPGLTFDRPQTASLAKLRHQRQQKTLEYQFLAEQLPNLGGILPTSARGVLAFGANMVGSISNPVDLAILAFASPAEAESLAARAIPLFSKYPTLTASVINNATQQAIIEIPRAWTDIQEQGAPDWSGIAKDIVIGGAFAEGLRMAGHLMAKVGRTTLEAAFRKATNDAIEGKPIDVSANLAQDPAIVRHEVEVRRLRQVEEELRRSPQVADEVKAQVDELMKDKAWVQERMKEANPKGHLKEKEALALVKEQVTAAYTDTVALARASLRELGHVGKASKRGVHLIAKDFVESLSVMTDKEKVRLSPTVEKIQSILNESKGSSISRDQAKKLAKDLGLPQTKASIDHLIEKSKSPAAELSNSQALRIAKALGLSYDWRTEGGLIPSTAGGSPIDTLFNPKKVYAQNKRDLVVKQMIIDDARRKEIVGDVIARDEMFNELTKQELAARIKAHAEEVIRKGAKGDTKPLTPEVNEVPPADARAATEEEMKSSLPSDKIAKEDIAVAQALLQKDLSKLESLKELTKEEKAFIDDDSADLDTSENFVNAVVEAATGCVTGTKHGK
jgi:hypothetical protein